MREGVGEGVMQRGVVAAVVGERENCLTKGLESQPRKHGAVIGVSRTPRQPQSSMHSFVVRLRDRRQQLSPALAFNTCGCFLSAPHQHTFNKHRRIHCE